MMKPQVLFLNIELASFTGLYWICNDENMFIIYML